MFSGRKDVYSVDKPGIVKAMCEHTSIVQEFFQIRVRKWLQIAGAGVFGIKHYWVRYEFAHPEVRCMPIFWLSVTTKTCSKQCMKVNTVQRIKSR